MTLGPNDPIPACVHRGEHPVSKGKCKGCHGTVEVPIFECNLHDTCSMRKKAEGAEAICAECDDIEPPEPTRMGRRQQREKRFIKAVPKARPDINKCSTVLVTTYNRPDKCRTFLQSVNRCYPGLKVLVGDNGKRKLNLDGIKDAEYHRLPHDCGLSLSRNLLLEKVKTEYVYLCEDDYVFFGHTDLGAMLDVLVAKDTIGIVGGSSIEHGERIDYATNLEIFRRQLSIVDSLYPIEFIGGHPARRCDQVWNFFCARTEVLKSNLWDPDLKLAEHWDFFLRLKEQAHWRVYHTPACAVIHDREGRTGKYQMDRARASVFMKTALKRHGLTRAAAKVEGYIGTESPNILVLGVGSSGTSVLTEMINALGWMVAKDNDPKFFEPEGVRALNERIRKRRPYSIREMHMQLGRLPKPWVLKDPRFAETWQEWQEAFVPYKPLLVYITRDEDQTIGSWKDRWGTEDEALIKYRIEQAEQCYEHWPYVKLRITLEDLIRAHKLFDPERVRTHRKDPCVHPSGHDLVSPALYTIDQDHGS